MDNSKKLFEDLDMDEGKIIQVAHTYRLLKWFGVTILGAVFVGVIVEFLSILGLNIFYGYLVAAMTGLLLYFPIANYYRDKNYLTSNRGMKNE